MNPWSNSEHQITTLLRDSQSASWGPPQPGEHVVDIGSGAGMDSIIAAAALDGSGQVIGVDMTTEMLGALLGNEWEQVIKRAGLVDTEFGDQIDTFGGSSGEANARSLVTYGYAIRATKPKE